MYPWEAYTLSHSEKQLGGALLSPTLLPTSPPSKKNPPLEGQTFEGRIIREVLPKRLTP